MAPTAERAVLCGDPARALMIAQELLVEPRMSNHHRGLWGYHGVTATGLELTVQATGIGGTSGALVLGELARRGTTAAIRVGTARSLDVDPPLGHCLAVEAVEARDGTAAAYGARPGATLATDPGLTAGLASRCGGSISLVSWPRPDPGPRLTAGTALPVHDLQSAALVAAAAEARVRLAVGVVISRNATGPLDDDPLESAARRLARWAVEVLERSPSSSG